MYDREFWDSKSYQKLTISARNLFEFLLRERRYSGKGNDRIWLNNGEISFNRDQFQKLYGYSNQACIDARNLLIEVGIIKLERVGGQGRGDMNEYSILYQCYPKKERWRDYPNKDWRHEVPQHKGKSLGKKWKKGESGNPKFKKKPSLSEQTLNGGKLSTKVAPTKPTSIYKDRHLNSVETEGSE